MLPDIAERVRSEGQEKDAQCAGKNCEKRRLVLRHVENMWPSVLSSEKPGDEGTQHKGEAGNNYAGLFQPGLVAAVEEDQFRKLNRYENDHDALVDQHK